MKTYQCRQHLKSNSYAAQLFKLKPLNLRSRDKVNFVRRRKQFKDYVWHKKPYFVTASNLQTKRAVTQTMTFIRAKVQSLDYQSQNN